MTEIDVAALVERLKYGWPVGEEDALAAATALIRLGEERDGAMRVAEELRGHYADDNNLRMVGVKFVREAKEWQARAEKAEAALAARGGHREHERIAYEATIAARDKRIAELEAGPDVAALVERAAPMLTELYCTPDSERIERWVTAAVAALTRLGEYRQECLDLREDIDRTHEIGVSWQKRAQATEAEVTRLREALTEIERYSKEGHVKRRARAALDTGEKP